LPTAEPIPIQVQAPAGSDPGLDAALFDLLRLAVVLGGGQAVLALWDRQGVWFRAGAGLSRSEWEELEPWLAGSADGREEGPGSIRDAPGWRLLGWAPLSGWQEPGRTGRVWSLARRAGAPGSGLPESGPPGSGPPGRGPQAELGPALALGAALLQRYLALQAGPAEQRSRPRGPSGSSFVPGLVHELRNFSFGISGSLDAFQARFGRQAELARYEHTMRASLDQLGAFLDELQDYGDPSPPAWAVGDPERVLRAAVDRHRAWAAGIGVDLRLDLAGPLPPVRMDEAQLEEALARLVGLALSRQLAGGRVTVRAEALHGVDRRELAGHVEGVHLAFPGMDPARLFEPFYVRVAGFGRLALPVARRVLERHGGTLSALPAPDGRVRLAFTLPAAAP
jgi:signal transduction histidine kinase